MIDVIDVGDDFSPRLINRDKTQGDGRFSGVEFREKYLSGLEKKEMWKSNDVFITLDFEHVEKIGPSFANEVFAYFCQYVKDKAQIHNKIKFQHITKVKMSIINEEINSGFDT